MGIKNNPSKEEIQNLKDIAENVFQPVRDHFDVPIAVTSGYRSKALNKAIGGAKNSEHVAGRALDLDADVFGGVTNKRYVVDYLSHVNAIFEAEKTAVDALAEISSFEEVCLGCAQVLTK